MRSRGRGLPVFQHMGPEQAGRREEGPRYHLGLWRGPSGGWGACALSSAESVGAEDAKSHRDYIQVDDAVPVSCVREDILGC